MAERDFFGSVGMGDGVVLCLVCHTKLGLDSPSLPLLSKRAKEVYDHVLDI